MQGLSKTFLFLAVGVTLTGCATISGSQDPVLELTPRSLVPISQALENYHKSSDGGRLEMSRRDYRDYILSSYLSAIEANYTAFTTQLQSSDRGSALGLDLLVMGLTGATALVGAGDVNNLATITAIASGTRATIDKRLFFDRTLPAIMASMDAERAIIKAEIARKRSLPIELYSLDEAVDDLHRLQQAGRLDRAVARLTRVAETDRTQQQARLNAVAGVCDDISLQAGDLNLEFRLLVMSDAATRPARLLAAASELDMEVPAGTTPDWLAVAANFDRQLCDDVRKRAFIDNLRTRLGIAAG